MHFLFENSKYIITYILCIIYLVVIDYFLLTKITMFTIINLKLNPVTIQYKFILFKIFHVNFHICKYSIFPCIDIT